MRPDEVAGWRRDRVCCRVRPRGLAVRRRSTRRAAAAIQVADLVRQVRTALGHGDVADARAARGRRGQGDPADARSGRWPIVEIFEGKYAEARTRLTPLADAAPLGEAALELGLLEVRTGRRAEGLRRLDPLHRRAQLRRSGRLLPARARRPGDARVPARQRRLSSVSTSSRAPTSRPSGATCSSSGTSRAMRSTSYRRRSRSTRAGCRRWSAWRGRLPTSSRRRRARPSSRRDRRRRTHPDVWLVDGRAEARRRGCRGGARGARPGGQGQAGDDRRGRASRGRRLQGRRARRGRGRPSRACARSIRRRRSAIGSRASRPRATIASTTPPRSRARRSRSTRTTPLAYFALGLALMRTGDEPAARTALETSWDLDKSSPSPRTCSTCSIELDTFEIVSHNDFIFKFAKDEAAVLKVYALPLADEAYQQFVERYGFTPQGPILVEVFPQPRRLRGAHARAAGARRRARRVLRPRRHDGLAARAAAGRLQLAGDALARARARVLAAAVRLPRAALADRRHLGLRGASAAGRRGVAS